MFFKYLRGHEYAVECAIMAANEVYTTLISNSMPENLQIYIGEGITLFGHDALTYWSDVEDCLADMRKIKYIQ